MRPSARSGARRTKRSPPSGERSELALAALLAAERADTDLRLLLERTSADELVSSRDDIISIVSHDLRSFLGAIALNAEMLRRLAETNRELVEAVRHSEGIQQIAAQMTRIVGDLLDAASIEAGKIAIVVAANNAGRLTRKAVELFQPAASAAGVSLTADVADQDLGAMFDADRLLQVLANVVGNALKFTVRGGRVVVRVGREDGVIQFAVEDSGEGIPPDKLETIFERFSQGGRADRRGLGLGLFIAKRIIDAHGGQMWVKSTLRKGSTFFFTIPCAR